MLNSMRVTPRSPIASSRSLSRPHTTSRFSRPLPLTSRSSCPQRGMSRFSYHPHVETNRYKAQAEAAVEKEMEQLTYERDAARWDATKAKEDLKAVNVELDGAKAYLDVLNENIDAGLDTAAGLNDEIASLRVTLADGREAETALVGRIHVL